MSPVQLNLGCGADTPPGFVNVDIVALPGVDVVCDLDQAGWPWKDGTVAYIKASHLFEHLADPVLFMAEAWRVLEDGGLLDIRVPGGHELAPGYWLPHWHSFTDPTHRRHCTPLTWMYWIPGTPLHEGYGAGLGSPPVVFEHVEMTLNGEQQEELRTVLRKAASDG